ncbi:MAG: amidohydrolase [Rickettsiales bacterium]|jgi:predicted amidohydrolase|nr:amidohydrolase [Rickettsiales bacterium]
MPTVACIQLSTQDTIEINIREATLLIEEAAAKGADFIALPENVSCMGVEGEQLKALSPAQDRHPVVKAMQENARKLGKWILVGSVPVAIGEQDRLSNRSLLINNEGTVVAAYNKIHLFDADPGDARAYRESSRFYPGEKSVIAKNTPIGTLGMTICYDLRFAYLYRALAQAGAECITVPSAFTYTTGIAHWHTLLRARAIETGCYIIAPGQCGTHPGHRRTYGHSLIVNPWGEIIAEADEQPGVTLASIDLAQVHDARKRVASLSHDRKFSFD